MSFKLACILALTAVSLQAATLNGSVFVVTRSGVAMKLALARVYLLTAAQTGRQEEMAAQQSKALESALAEKRAEMERKLAELDAQPQPALAEIEAAKARMPDYEAARARAIDALSHPPMKSDFKTKAQYAAARKKWEEEDCKFPDETAPRALNEARWKYERACGHRAAEKDRLNDVLSNTERQARLELVRLRQAEPNDELRPAVLTDSEGRFSIELPAETALIAIYAERETQAENYVWKLTRADAEKTAGGTVLFSNHNMLR